LLFYKVRQPITFYFCLKVRLHFDVTNLILACIHAFKPIQ